MVKECLNCEKEFEEKNVGKMNEKKYCCWKCSDEGVRRAYSRRMWKEGKAHKPSKETLRKSANKNYENNKKKWHSRTITKEVVRLEKVKLKEECKMCGKKDNLELHHKEYPTKIKDIRKAVEEGNIFYLCKKHHGLTRRK